MAEELPQSPRAVKPRIRSYKRLPVVVVDTEGFWISETGETGPLTDLLTKLPEYPPTLFVARGAADIAAQLDAAYAVSHPTAWQWRVTTNERGIVRPDGVKVAARISVAIHYLGFKGGNYHKFIDPTTMYGHSIDTIWPGDEPPITRLLQWAIALRDFCDENMLEIRPTIGSISGQFLTDRRFYPHPRRKVPQAINTRARDELPGNYYALSVMPSPRHYFTALYLDQRRAHHYHARTTPLPDANNLYAYGWFQTLDSICFDNVEPDFHGLYCLDLELPAGALDPTMHWINPTTRIGKCFVFSNEVPHLLDMGYKINGVIAAWGSHKRDTGIARYATFAERELDRHSDPPWLKPLLLATYGTLATRPSWGETVFKLAKRGEQIGVATGRGMLNGTLVRAPQKLEPKIANVIHRGMIEAATRADSLGLAHWLTGQGYRILSIYADAVMVEQDDDKTLPDLPDPWRLKQTLNHLQFVSQQAFMSGEMTKLPGVTRELKDYSRRSTGRAPRRKLYDVLSGQAVKTDRRI